MRSALFLLCAVLPLFLLGTLLQGDESPRLVKQPLDLPAGGLGDDDEEEEAAETIVFYGNEFEGDAFFWCFPAYGFCGETTVFNAIKQEVNAALGQLSPRAWMGLVGYNTSSPFVWSYQPKKATTANKAGARTWMNALVPIESHCLLEGALATLQISNSSPGKHKKVIICGAREPYCSGQNGTSYVENCLTAIAGANYSKTPIDTIYFTSSFYSGESHFYQDLAAMNKGSFQQVDY